MTNRQSMVFMLRAYSECNADNVDDQPVDYSKKYSDQDTDDVCRPSKSDTKSHQFASSDVPSSQPQTYNDEVKVYCIEGTPLTISSASSFCDLRDVGTDKKIVEKHNFSLVQSYDNLCEDDFENKDSVKTYAVEKDPSPIVSEKDDIAKENKSVTFKNEEDISKASSPMMFSRSSSICSLNSFEQQSVIDDRSSVSVFSTLASGIISPSDLPDSPGDLMSPVLTDKEMSSPKNYSKAGSDNESLNSEVFESDKMETEFLENKESDKKLNESVLLCNSKDEELISSANVEDGNHNNSLSDPSPELEMLNTNSENSMVKTNSDGNLNKVSDIESIPRITDLSKSNDNSDDDDDEDDVLLKHCIEQGMPKKTHELDINNSHLYHDSRGASSSEKVYVINDPLSDNLSVKSDANSDNDNALLQKCIRLGMSSNPQSKQATNNLARVGNEISHVIQNKAEVVPPKSDDDSDSDDDVLLQQCIQLGMPKPVPNEKAMSPVFKIAYHQNEQATNKLARVENEESHVIQNNLEVAASKSDDGSDSEDDALLQRCIQLGMPKPMPNEKAMSPIFKVSYHQNEQATNKLSRAENGKNHAIQNKPEVVASKSDDDDSGSEDDVLLQECIQRGMPNPIPNEKAMSPVFNNSHPQNEQGTNKLARVENGKSHLIQNKPEVVASKSDDDSDGEDDVLLQRCIQLGMPKPVPSKKTMSPVFKNSYPKQPANNSPPPQSARDNCPDGVSDDDEDDNLLANGIMAGMPTPRTSISEREQTPEKTIPKNYHSPNHAFFQEPKTLLNKKIIPQRHPQTFPNIHSGIAWISNTSFIDVDSMRIYRTEDTPILSPTASVSDLSSLSFTDDKSCREGFLNNSRNSNCSSDDDDDELLLQCIRSGMPEAKRAVA